ALLTGALCRAPDLALVPLALAFDLICGLLVNARERLPEPFELRLRAGEDSFGLTPRLARDLLALCDLFGGFVPLPRLGCAAVRQPFGVDEAPAESARINELALRVSAHAPPVEGDRKSVV